MRIGSLVKMIDDPWKILGVVIEVIDDRPRSSDKVYYKVSWIDELCDPSYADEDVLEVLCE